MQVKAINYNNIVNFKAKQPKSLAEKYNINVSKLPIIKSKNIEITPEEKALLVEKLLEAHELAKKNINFNIYIIMNLLLHYATAGTSLPYCFYYRTLILY
jgi:hypothetical protein